MDLKMQQLLEECINYFKNRKVYKKLFDAIRRKYASLGHMGGIIKLKNLTDNEKYELEGFFKKDFHIEDDVRISYALMEKALKQSRFTGLLWEDIITGYYGKPLAVKKQEKEKKLNSQKLFFEKCAAACKDNNVLNWFKYVWQKKGKGFQILLKMYNKDKDGLYIFLGKLFYALENLPCYGNKMLPLPVFAAGTTGNPHFFDLNTQACKLLLNYIRYQYADIPGKVTIQEGDAIKNQKQGITGIFNTGGPEEAPEVEQIERLLYSAGILKDHVSNMCLLYGIHASKKDGSLHRGIEGYFEEKEPVQLTLKTLNTLGSIQAEDKSCNGLKNIYIVENPAVFSYLTDNYPDGTFICGNGQFKLAFYITLELLRDKNPLYYAGDFDADGLLIAQKLKKRYPSQVVFWEYKAEHYYKHFSNVGLDNVSLAKLAKIEDPGLQEIKQCLLENKKAAYQEAMLEAYVINNKCPSVMAKMPG